MVPPNNKGNEKNKNPPKAPITTDPRFANVHNDPRFLRPKKKDLKVTIDKRFASMMESTDFSDAPSVDKYGRPLKKQSAKKELERFYQLEDEDEEGQEKSVEELEKELAADAENLRDEESEDEDESEQEESADEEEGYDKDDKGYDPMRGRGVISDSDSDESDEESDADVEDKEMSEEDLDELDKIKTVHEGEETSRLALVNMDWDKIKAVDILKVINGFKPDTGVVKNVAIYPSEFGKERMALEDAQGPPPEIFKTKRIKSDDDDDDNNSSDDDDEEITAETIIKNQLEEGDGQDFDQEALRKYQLDRLKYYYAVITCDSPQTAKTIYKLCDGTEYENSANFFDLRYIPEDMTFDDEPKDVASVAPEGYQPTKFKTDALQQTKVSLTWDEDDVNRYQLTRREFTQEDLKELDFDAYLASTDEEDDEGEDLNALREKYRKLLNSEKNTSAFEDGHEGSDEEEGDMEITFTPGLSEAAAAAASDKEEEEEKENETTIEKYIRKQKEKRKAKKEKAKQQQKADSDDSEGNASDLDEETKNDPYFKEALEEMEKEGFTDGNKAAEKKKKKRTRKRASKEEREQKAKERAELELLMGDQAKGDGFDMKEVLKAEKLEKKKKRKGKKGKKGEEAVATDDFEIDVSDPRFAAIKESHHFAIDPTNPHFKKTKNMQKLIDARQSKMKEDQEMTDVWKKDSIKSSASASTADSSAEAAPKSSSLQQLVASVKRKGALDPQAKNSGKRQKN